jgi:CheY-like chemotaxis protein
MSGDGTPMTAETGASPTSIINLSSAHVLLVDDSSFGLRLLEQMMKGFGVRACYTCSSSLYAQDVIRREAVDLIVIDCDMPELDGYDLIRWMRNSGLENAHTPVVMVAGHTKASKVKKARDCGAKASFSLLELADRFRENGRCELAPIQVHVQALRLPLGSGEHLPAAARDEILNGLDRVLARAPRVKVED